MKTWIANNCGDFVDISQASEDGTFDAYFAANPSESEFPAWTVSSLCTYLGVPSDYFTATKTPWRGLTDPDTAYGWHAIDDACNALVWMQKTASLTEDTTRFDTPWEDSQEDCLIGESTNWWYGQSYGAGWSGYSTCAYGSTLYDEDDSQTEIDGTNYGELSPCGEILAVGDLVITNGTPVQNGTLELVSYAYGHGYSWSFLEAWSNEVLVVEYSDEDDCDLCGLVLKSTLTNLYWGYYSRLTHNVGGTFGVSTGLYACSDNMITNCEVDVYTILTPLSPTRYYSATGYQIGQTSFGGWTNETPGSLTEVPGAACITNVTVTHPKIPGGGMGGEWCGNGTVDLWTNLTELTGWGSLAKDQTISVTSTNYPGHNVESPTVAITNLLTELVLTNGFGDSQWDLEFDWNQAAEEDLWIDCDIPTNGVCETHDEHNEYTQVGMYDGEERIIGWTCAGSNNSFNAETPGDIWGCTQKSELMLIRYDVENGFDYR